VTVTNSLTLDRGEFLIDKELVNEDGVDLSQETFVIDYAWETNDDLNITAGDGSVEVVAGEDPMAVTGVPAGAVVSFSEQTPGEVTGATWHDAVIDPETVTIEADDVVTVTVTNTITADDPGKPGTPDDLPRSGVGIGLGAAALALLILGIGGFLVYTSRRGTVN